MLIALLVALARNRWLLAGVFALVLVCLSILLDSDQARIFTSRGDLIKAQKAQNYVLVGTLGRPEWPAVVAGRETGKGEVSFVTADGQRHQYQGFSGPMKALAFRAGLDGSKRFTLVFHRVEKAPVDNSPFKGIR
jgi:hypothetical protein